MSKARDEEVRLPGIVPREHRIVKLPSGRCKYPFKAMVVGDFCRVLMMTEAIALRSALRSFYKRNAGRRFTVRQRDDGEWICRRTM